MGAALAYYTTFSIAPLLLVVVAVAGLFLGREAVEGKLYEQIQGLVGSGAAEQISTMLRNANQNRSDGILGTVIGLGAILFGATTAFAQLQAALNRAWQVKPNPRLGGIRNFIMKRLLSLGMVLSIGFLLLVSLVMSAALAGFNQWSGSMLPGFLSARLVQALHFLFSFALVTLLFAAIFKVLPDAEIGWRSVWVGAVLTALLFTVGKFLIGVYLGQSGTASTYGAAGSLIVIILWVYYASLIVLMGAEFTQVWAESRGSFVQPEEGATHVAEFPLRKSA
jgi:membrane protein